MSLTLAKIHARCDEYGECLLWRQSCTPSGYPRWGSGGYAHLLAWTLVHGPIPEGLRVRRTCNETRCCNVKHMLLVTRSQQNKIAAKRGAWKSPARIARITAAMRERGKLDSDKARLIRESPLSGVALAAQFNVSRSLISKVRKGEAWAETARNASVFNLAA